MRQRGQLIQEADREKTLGNDLEKTGRDFVVGERKIEFSSLVHVGDVCCCPQEFSFLDFQFFLVVPCLL